MTTDQDHRFFHIIWSRWCERWYWCYPKPRPNTCSNNKLEEELDYSHGRTSALSVDSWSHSSRPSTYCSSFTDVSGNHAESKFYHSCRVFRRELVPVTCSEFYHLWVWSSVMSDVQASLGVQLVYRHDVVHCVATYSHQENVP